MKKQGYQPKYPCRTSPPNIGGSVKSCCKREIMRGEVVYVSKCFCRAGNRGIRK